MSELCRAGEKPAGRKHEWCLTVSRTVGPMVHCTRCYERFVPITQQMPYKGVVPERYNAVV